MRKVALAVIVVLCSITLSSSYCMAAWPKTAGTRCWEMYRTSTGEKQEDLFLKLRIVRETRKLYRVMGSGEYNEWGGQIPSVLSGTALRNDQNIAVSMTGAYFGDMPETPYAIPRHWTLLINRDTLVGTLGVVEYGISGFGLTIKPIACKLLS